MKIIDWWKSRTTNEKMMWGLIAVLIIGILTRWNYVWEEVAAAFGSYFQ